MVEPFEDIYKKHFGRVYRQCLSLAGDHETAMDFTQDIFLKVFKELASFKGQSSIATWLYAITFNYCIDRMRLTKKLKIKLVLPEMLYNISETHQSTFDTESEPVNLDTLDRAMKDLSSGDVELLRLKYEKGMPIRLISEEYKVSESNIKMRLMRARKKLLFAYERRAATLL